MLTMSFIPEERTFANADEWFEDWTSRWQEYQRLIPKTIIGITAGFKLDNKLNVDNMYRILKEKDGVFAAGPASAESWMAAMEGNLNFHSRYLPLLWQSVACGTEKVRVQCGQVSLSCS